MRQQMMAKLQTLKFTAAVTAMTLAASLYAGDVHAQTAKATPADTNAAKAAQQTPAPDSMGLMPSSNSAADLENAIRQAQALRKSGDFQGAAKTLSQLLLFSADDGRVLAEYGKTLIALGRLDDALAFLERAIQVEPSDWSLYSAIGVVHDEKGNYQAARMAYSQALSLKPNDPSVLNNAALSYMQSGDLDSAERLLQQAMPGSAENPRITQNLTMVQNLKASRPVPPVAAAAAPTPAPAPVASVPAPAPAAVAPAPVATAQAPAAPPAPVHTPAPTAAAPAPAPVVAAPAQAPVAAAAPKPAPAPATVPAQVAMEPLPAPEKPKAEAAPKAAAPQPPVQTASVKTPAPAAASSGLAALQADPTVRMAPVPKDDLAGPAKRPTPVKAEPAQPEQVASLVPQKIAPNFVTAPAAKPAPAAQPAVQRVSNSSGKTAYYVQAGSFGTPERADRMAHTLDSLGARVQPANVDGHAVYRVRIGPFLDIQQANAAVAHAQEMGHADLKIISE